MSSYFVEFNDYWIEVSYTPGMYCGDIQYHAVNRMREIKSTLRPLSKRDLQMQRTLGILAPFPPEFRHMKVLGLWMI